MTVSRRDKEVDISKKQVVGKEEVEGKFWVSNQQCPWNRILYLIVTLLFQMKDYSIYNLSIPASYPYIQLQTVSTSTNFLKLPTNFLAPWRDGKHKSCYEQLWCSDLSCSALHDWEVPKIQTILPSRITHAQSPPFVWSKPIYSNWNVAKRKKYKNKGKFLSTSCSHYKIILAFPFGGFFGLTLSCRISCYVSIPYPLYYIGPFTTD